jgi:hypothetical protein
MLFLTGKRGAQPLSSRVNDRGKGLNRLAHSAIAAGRTSQSASPVAGLASFFPDATPVRIPVQLAVSSGAEEDSHPSNFTESTVIEFGTPREVLFCCSTPLEFADVLRLRNSDGSLDVEAAVVAVQYHPGKAVVAARFLREVPNWIVKP